MHIIISDCKIRPDELSTLSEDQLRNFGIEEFQAKLLTFKLKGLDKIPSKRNIGSDVTGNLSYADVTKSTVCTVEKKSQPYGSNSSSSATKLGTSSIVHNEVSCTPRPERIGADSRVQIKNELQSMLAEDFLKSLGLEITLSPGELLSANKNIISTISKIVKSRKIEYLICI